MKWCFFKVTFVVFYLIFDLRRGLDEELHQMMILEQARLLNHLYISFRLAEFPNLVQKILSDLISEQTRNNKKYHTQNLAHTQK